MGLFTSSFAKRQDELRKASKALLKQSLAVDIAPGDTSGAGYAALGKLHDNLMALLTDAHSHLGAAMKPGDSTNKAAKKMAMARDTITQVNAALTQVQRLGAVANAMRQPEGGVVEQDMKGVHRVTGAEPALKPINDGSPVSQRIAGVLQAATKHNQDALQESRRGLMARYDVLEARRGMLAGRREGIASALGRSSTDPETRTLQLAGIARESNQLTLAMKQYGASLTEWRQGVKDYQRQYRTVFNSSDTVLKGVKNTFMDKHKADRDRVNGVINQVLPHVGQEALWDNQRANAEIAQASAERSDASTSLQTANPAVRVGHYFKALRSEPEKVHTAVREASAVLLQRVLTAKSSF